MYMIADAPNKLTQRSVQAAEEDVGAEGYASSTSNLLGNNCDTNYMYLVL
jgi:hypothetical protein